MTVQSALDGICKFFGGPYDAATRTYRTSPVAGVGVVRRGWAKRDDHADYFHGMPPGARTGCQIVVRIADQDEGRETLGPAGVGLMRIVYDVELDIFVRSNVAHAEDAQDDVYALRDALSARLRSDHTLGHAVFQAGEAVQGGNNRVRFHYGQPSSKGELTKSFMTMRFSAVELTA